MSLFYRFLKPIARKVVKGGSLHREESYEEFVQASYDIQKKFKFRLPVIKGYEFRDEPLGGQQTGPSDCLFPRRRIEALADPL